MDSNESKIRMYSMKELQNKYGKPTPLGVGWIAQKIKIMCM